MEYRVYSTSYIIHNPRSIRHGLHGGILSRGGVRLWVAEVFLVMHAYALCRLPHKVEWNDFWGINYLCTYIPTLPNSPKRSALYIRIFIRIFSASLVIIPPTAIVSARLHLPLHTAFYALLYGQAAVGTACSLILLKKKWTQHR